MNLIQVNNLQATVPVFVRRFKSKEPDFKHHYQFYVSEKECFKTND